MGIISFESFSLVCIFVALGAYLVWQQVKEAGRNIEATLDSKPKDAVSDQAQEDEKERRRMEFEADAKFWRELGQENLDKFTANMEPFCGEGKKLTEKEKREELASLNLPAIANTPEYLRPDPYSYEANLAKAVKRTGEMPWYWPKL